jgi:hypothetical protein
MPKDLVSTINQIQIMSELAVDVKCVKGANLKNRALGDLERIANSAWLNLYDYLKDNDTDPDKHFNKQDEE